MGSWADQIHDPSGNYDDLLDFLAARPNRKVGMSIDQGFDLLFGRCGRK
jgi:hypothetical protein